MDFIFDESPNELAFKTKDGKEIVFSYRDPDADERIRYGSAMGRIYADGKAADDRFEEATKIQFQFGKSILTGFRMSGIETNVSSDPSSPDYRENWKDLVCGRAPDLAIMLCQEVFERGGFTPAKN